MTKKQMIEIDGIECPEGFEFDCVGRSSAADVGRFVSHNFSGAIRFDEFHVGEIRVFLKELKPKRIVFEEVLPRPESATEGELAECDDGSFEYAYQRGSYTDRVTAVYRRAQSQEGEE